MAMQSESSQRSEQNGRPAAFDENAPIGNIKALYGAIERWKPQIASLAPKNLDVDRFGAIVMSCASRVPKILLCSYYSIRQSVQAAAELGLDLGGVSGEAYLIPYENRKKIQLPNGREEWIVVLEATFIAGYKGYLRLAYESGLFRDIGCGVILPDDEWLPIKRGPNKLEWGHVQGEPKRHPPMKIAAVRYQKGSGAQEYDAEIAPLRGAYAYVKLTNPAADDIVKAIWIDRLEEIRLRSKAGKNGPWITDYAEMAQKTAIRNLWKYIPKTEAMKRAEELDQEFDFEDVTKDAREPRTPEVVTAREPVDVAKAKTDRVAERVKANAAKANGAPPPPASSRPNDCPPNLDGDDGPDYQSDADEGRA